MAIAIAQILALPQALQRIDIYHAIFVACFSLPATVGVLVRFAPRSLELSRFTRLASAGVLVAGVVGASIYIATRNPLSLVENSGRSVPLVATDANRLRQVIDMVHAEVLPGSRFSSPPLTWHMGSAATFNCTI